MPAPRVRVSVRAPRADVPMCAHGIAMRRCDDCGAFVASHAGVPAHVCGSEQRTCADAALRFDVLDAETHAALLSNVLEPEAARYGREWSSSTRKPHHIMRHGVRPPPLAFGGES